MKPLMLLRESWASIRARVVPALMVAALCASMCATTLLTVGRTASAETEVLARMEHAGSRELVVGDRLAAGLLTPTIVGTVTAMDTVERAVGLTIAQDVRNGYLTDGGQQVPAWGVVGNVTDVATLASGRDPMPGEALISQEAMATLGLDGPVGHVVQGAREYPIVGTYTVREPFTDLDAGVVIAATPQTTARTLHVIAADTQTVTATQQLTLGIIAAPRPEDLTVQSATALATLQGEIAGDLGLFGRQLLLLVLGAGAVLTSVVVLADVLLRRADLGRRRALGATRRGLIALVMLRGLIAAAIGVSLGTVLSLAILRTWEVMVPASFIVGTMTLTLLSALAAALGPATIAATRDPVSILRTP